MNKCTDSTRSYSLHHLVMTPAVDPNAMVCLAVLNDDRELVYVLGLEVTNGRRLRRPTSTRSAWEEESSLT